MPTAKDISKMTPMLRQFYELKNQCPDAILLFRMGDFYEVFGEDAAEIAPKLDIVLTSREKGKDAGKIPFCGVPHHSAKTYWLKLLKLGYKVAICEQTEDPTQAKGLVKREIVRILTPGCIEELEGLNPHAANYLMAVYEDPESKAITSAITDISTGELRLGEVESKADLLSLIETFRPKEIVCRKFFEPVLIELTKSYRANETLIFSSINESILRDSAEQKKLLKSVFNKTTVASFPCQKVNNGELVVAGLFHYLKSLFIDLNQFLSILPLTDPETMTLHENVIRDLEIFETARRRQAQGSLFSIINHCLSPMGTRLLRQSLISPLLDMKKIKDRQNTVASFFKLGEIALDEIRDSIKNTPDLERLITRLMTHKISPIEINKLRAALEAAISLHNFLQPLSETKDHKFPGIKDLLLAQKSLDTLNKALVDDVDGFGGQNGVFRRGYDTKLDALSELAQNGSAQIDAYMEKLREETGITSLKIKQHKTYGLLIEVTKSNLNKVPDTFIRRQTMVNNERFVTPELQELDEKLASASDERQGCELQLYQDLIQTLAKEYKDLKKVSASLANLDMLQGLAWLALRHNYVKALINETGLVSLKASRHPVVECFLSSGNFIANDIELSRDQPQALITGPNMAGKSTIMRQLAVIALLNQIGSFVPAQKAELPVFDQIFTRIGASDDLTMGQSTFMVEMSEAAQILRECTENSLVILDEVGRGTSTQDGLAVASAILEHLATNKKCYCLFATHYHELVAFGEKFSSLRFLRTEVEEGESGIVFTHKISTGSCGNSFGIEVAKLAGIPKDVLKSAENYLVYPQGVETQTQTTITKKGPDSILPEVSALERKYPRASEIIEKIQRVAIYKTNPLQALNLLQELQLLLTRPKTKALFEEEFFLDS